ncbi:hypothetical protein [Algoriella sp.]|uniref:hypothetical protein n=1 Tax=Algoriella sp. TaxID=1872434 RepID=UPI002FC9432A
MKGTFKSFYFFVLLLFVCAQLQAQARLTIENNSQRSMTVKVMKGSGKMTLHKTVTISSYGSEIIYFSESGQYFTKSKAVLKGKEPVYQKGQPFQVTNDERGYSVMTLTFSIKESTVPQLSGGKQISKSEFDKN